MDYPRSLKQWLHTRFLCPSLYLSTIPNRLTQLVHGQDLILGRFEETVELITLIAENDKKRERPIHRDGVLLERLDKVIELLTRLVQLAFLITLYSLIITHYS